MAQTGRVNLASQPAAGASRVPSTGAAHRIALVPWGDVFEDYLDGIGLSFEAFRTEMTGGWMFGYIEALRRAGIETVLFCVSAHAHRVRHTVHVPSGTPIRVLPALAPYRLARRIRSRLAPHVAPYLATPYRLFRHEIAATGCDLILSQEYENPRFDALVAIGESLQIPVFATFQGGTWHTSIVERWTRKRALERSAGLIIAPVTESARVQERYGVPREKIHRIFNPLDVAEWKAEPREQARAALGIPATARVAIWHGRVDLWTKGIDLLLDAWRQVQATHGDRDLRLIMLGSGRDSARLHQMLADRPVPGLEWKDEYLLDRPALRRYLSAADVYVFPSRHEGFPVAPLEAMACGLPVVAAAAPGIPDILEGGEAHGGVRVPLDDSAALAAALGHLLNDPTRCRTLGQHARRRIEDAFSLGIVGVQLHKVFAGSL